MEYYLRVEGVNLGHFVYDTNNLPAIRGGGLALLNAVERVNEELCKYSSAVEAITEGASWGLFRFTPKNGHTPNSIKIKVVDFLNRDDCLKHATFVVNIIAADRSAFVNNRNQLAALNRWQQMRSPSLAVPAPQKGVCSINKIRPADSTYTVADEPVSSSVYQRREFGREQKRKVFYLDRISCDNTFLGFTADFEELSSDSKQGNLHRKMAVIYIDGNKFGWFQETHCRNEESQQQFDCMVRVGQNHILDALIREAVSDINGAWKTEEGKIRLETLLWGGDEIILVVPAWLGLHVVDLFFRMAKKEFIFTEKTKQKKRNRKKKKTKKITTRQYTLHHAAGVVFCHHNSPIHRIIHLAKDLAERAKWKSDKNLFAYQLLESFEHAGTDLDTWRATRVRGLGTSDDLFINPDRLVKIEEIIAALKQSRAPEFPQRKIHQIINALKNGQQDNAEKLLNKLCGQHQELLAQLKLCLGNSEAMWLHLIDLWGYMGGQS